MGSVETEWLSSLFLLPDTIAIEAVYPTMAHLTIQVRCILKSAACPLCQHPSERIHGSYGRRVADVPCGGRKVTLALTVRKCVCGTPECPRQIFAERLPALVQSYARMTNRLSEALQTLGFATCGEVGERLAPKLGMCVSGPTLLRCMRTRSYSPPESVRILGIDDWAWKKGQTYGTILVDLETRRPLELLPDRLTETVEAWLRTHPEVDIVSRDRGGEYAAAARKGAPQAQQIADRFHVLKNLRERLKEVMDRKQSCLPEVEEHASDAIPARARGLKDQSVHEIAGPPAGSEPEKHYRTIPPYPYQRPAGMSYNDFQKQVRRDKRAAHYENVRTLFAQGHSQRAIARKLKLSRATVAKFVQAEVYPEMHHPNQGARRSQLDSYKGYLIQRWQHGCRNSVQLYDEITARGFTGSAPLRRQVSGRAEKKAPAGRLSLSPVARRFQADHRNSSFSAAFAPYYLPHVCHTRLLALCQPSRKAGCATNTARRTDSSWAPRPGDGVPPEPGVCHDAGRASSSGSGELANPGRTQRPARIQKNGEGDSPGLYSSQSRVCFGMEQWAGRSAGQLLKAPETDRVRQSQL